MTKDARDRRLWLAGKDHPVALPRVCGEDIGEESEELPQPLQLRLICSCRDVRVVMVYTSRITHVGIV